MAEHTLDLVGGEAGETLIVTDEMVGMDCRLIGKVRGETFVADERDFFEALLTIRRRSLEPKGLIPFCYGASLNAWPSGMARDMGSGRVVYRMEKGIPVAGPPIGIFKAGPDVIPSLVEAQEAFFQDWVRSTKARRPT